MTGREAMAEAARIEMARIYATTSPEYSRPAEPADLTASQKNSDELASRRARKASAAARAKRAAQRNQQEVQA